MKIRRHRPTRTPLGKWWAVALWAELLGLPPLAAIFFFVVHEPIGAIGLLGVWAMVTAAYARHLRNIRRYAQNGYEALVRWLGERRG